MTTRTASRKPTAIDAYVGQHQQLFLLANALCRLVQDMPEPESVDINWTHVEPMADANRKLAEIIAQIDANQPV